MIWPFKKQRINNDLLEAQKLLQELKKELLARDKERSAYIFAFSQVETRLSLLETLHGVRFETYDPTNLNSAGSGRHIAIEKKRLKLVISDLMRQWKAIDRHVKETVRWKKVGLKKQ